MPNRPGTPSTASSTGSEHSDSEYGATHDRGTTVHASLSCLLFSKKFSDMTIHCGGLEFKAHRAIVCSQSSFSGEFREAASRSIDLPDDDPIILERFLEFLYTGTYTGDVGLSWDAESGIARMVPKESAKARPVVLRSRSNIDREEYLSREFATDLRREHQRLMDREQDPSEEPTNLFLPLRLYVMADKYDVPSLKVLADKRFYQIAKSTWEETRCFPDVVKECYNSTVRADRAMRDTICQLVAPRIKKRRIREWLKPVMTEHGDFAFDIITEMVDLYDRK